MTLNHPKMSKLEISYRIKKMINKSSLHKNIENEETEILQSLSHHDYFETVSEKTTQEISSHLDYISILKSVNFIIHYTNISFLRYFLTDYGKIIARKNLLISRKYYRLIVKAIKKARFYNLLPVVLEFNSL